MLTSLQIRDVLIIKGEALSPRMIDEMRAAFPAARFTLYFWDGSQNLPKDTPQKMTRVDRVLSFDPADVRANPAIVYRPLFFLEEYAALPDERRQALDALQAIHRVTKPDDVDEPTYDAEQKRRLLQRLERPEKHWKWSSGDLDTRARWDDYRAAYSDALERCSTDVAPWYVVPADRKWYRDLAVAEPGAGDVHGGRQPRAVPR